MSHYFAHGDERYEVEEFGPVDEPGFHYELWGRSEHGQLLGRVIVAAYGEDDGAQLELNRPIDIELLLRWMYLVPELRDRVPVEPTPG